MSNTNQTIADLAAACVGQQKIEGLGETGIVLPEGYRVELFENEKSAPRRIKEQSDFLTIESYIAYITRYHTESTAVFCHPNSSVMFKTILDYHSNEWPAWCQHRAALTLNVTEDWRAWEEMADKWIDQRDIAEFFEDNIQNLVTPNASELLENIRDVKVGRTASMQSATAPGHTARSANETVSYSNKFPLRLTLKLQKYDYTSFYEVPARLDCKATDSGKFVFRVSIVKPENIQKAVFAEFQAKLAALDIVDLYI